MKIEIAKKVGQQMNDIMGQLDDSVRFVMENCSEEEFNAYRLGIARVMGALVASQFEFTGSAAV